MHRLTLLFFIFFSMATGAESKNRIVIQADTLNGDKQVLSASGHVVIEYIKTLFLADNVEYNKNSKQLTIYGNVRILNPDKSRIKTDKIVLHVSSKKVVFDKFFYKDSEEMWISSKTAIKQKNCYKLSDALVSSCLVGNPDWKLGFSEADYNSTSKYIKLKDIKFYIGDVPVFYFPYLAFSTSRERSSGLLTPYFGYNSEDGFIYEQPVYWNIAPDMDMEFNPQIRSNKSYGMYGTFRFANSADSRGSVRMGYFKDIDEYTNENDLKNDKHYGLEALYNSSNVLGDSRPDGYDDALYINLVFFNDIDYLSLQGKQLAHLSDSHLKESKLNYMLYSDDNYFGLNMNYFLDASKDSNSDTLQNLPSLRWHKYSTDFGLGIFDYSIDLKMHDYMRTNGSQSKQIEAEIPISYNFSLLDDYIKVQLGENIYIYSGQFDTELPIDSYSSVVLTHKAKVYGDIIKAYDKGTHTIEYSLAYEKQNYLGDSINNYNLLGSDTQNNFLPRKPLDERIKLQLNQYWHDNIFNLEAKQRVSQTYYPNRDEKWGDLRHELEFAYGKWHFSGLFEYSFEYKDFSELSNKITYGGDKFYLGTEFFWRKNLPTGLVSTKEIALNTRYKYSDTMSLFGSITYDLKDTYSKKWKTGFLYDKGCWSVELAYEHDTRPILESDGGGSVDSDTILLKVRLVPLGESEIRR